MNKRSFIKSILLAAVAPGLLLARSQDAYKWKNQNGLWVLRSSDWGPVQFADFYIDMPPVFDERIMLGQAMGVFQP